MVYGYGFCYQHQGRPSLFSLVPSLEVTIEVTNVEMFLIHKHDKYFNL